jgi:type VI secretion system protein ImpH
MATPGGTDDSDVSASGAAADRHLEVERLLREIPQEFDYFQAVRLIENVSGGEPVGGFAPPSKEAVRIRAHASLPFPASQIQRVDWPENGTPAVVINFMGLFGPSGLLPLYYTNLIVERIRQKDHALADFLDMFHHRMAGLFYRAWEKYRFTIEYERRAGEPASRDRFSHHLMDLIGLGTRGLEQRLAVRDDSLLYYAGLLSLHTRPAAALQRILWDYFDVPVEIEQFIGAWHRLEEPNQCRVGLESGASEQLGTGAIAGDEIWYQQSGARIKLGPLSLAEYLDFLPTGTAHEALKSLANFIGRGEIDFQVQLILKKDDVPACELGLEEPARLGWTSWAKTQPLRADAGDTIFAI